MRDLICDVLGLLCASGTPPGPSHGAPEIDAALVFCALALAFGGMAVLMNGRSK